GQSLQGAVGGQQEGVGVGGRELGEGPQVGVLGLGEGGGGLGQEARDRDDGLDQAADLGVGGHAVGDAAGGGHGVQPPDPDLVGTGEDGDGVDGVGARDLGVVEGVEEVEVVAVQVPHEVDDGVGGGVVLGVGGQGVPGARG